LGVDTNRVEIVSFGSNKSTAPKGDYEAYAMERRVDIEVFRPQLEMTLTQAH
jgi:outer membrane protein OmpA-like peptidoglycan-associated protein